jgi:cobalt-zinc-cadmium efflux system outer membrane protein
VLYLVGRQQILDQRATSATDVLGLAKTRFEHGDISGTDLDRLTLEEASVAREAAENLADLAEATSLCEEALTAPCKLTTASVSALATSARLPERLPDATPSAPHVPAARQLEELRLAVLGDAALARARVIPDPTVSVGYTRDWYTKAGNQPHTVGVSVSVPLPVLDTGYHAAEAASAEAQALADEVRAQLSHQRASIHGMLGRKGAIEGKLRTIRNDLLPRANDLEKSAQTAYLHGQLSMSGLVLVRRDLLSLRLDEVDTEYQLFQVRNQLRQLFQLDLSQARRTEPSNPRP